MIDIHCHVLPGLDDGPKSLDESMLLLNALVQQGATTVVCTPHFSLRTLNDKQTIEVFLARRDEALAKLNEKAVDQGLDVDLLPGLEIGIHSDLADLIHDSRFRSRLCLGNSSLILLEFTRFVLEQLASLDPLLYELQAAGLVPVLAHPERTLATAPFRVQQHLMEWAAQGRLLLQMNARSIVDLAKHPPLLDLPFRAGYGRRRLTRLLLQNELVSFVASDAHGIEFRPPLLTAAERYLSEQDGPELADRLLVGRAAEHLQQIS